jgi:hypothetical protein
MKLEMAQQNQHNHDEYVEEVNKVVSYDGPSTPLLIPILTFLPRTSYLG